MNPQKATLLLKIFNDIIPVCRQPDTGTIDYPANVYITYCRSCPQREIAGSRHMPSPVISAHVKIPA
jgi:hypothetical protein